MNNFMEIIKNDFRNYLKYSILQIVIILSLLFAGVMAFVPSFDPLIFIYITVFILPVIIFAIGIYIEAEEGNLLPLAVCQCPTVMVMLGKLVSSLILLMIPFILESAVMAFVLNIHFNLFLFFLIYVMAATMHVVIGTVLAIISRSTSIMSISYIAYIVLFSLIPIFYTKNLIPEAFQYVMVISPAYLSGVLFQEIYFGYAYSPLWLIILAITLQLAYITGLTLFVIRPYFKTYLVLSLEREGGAKRT